jgi:hypothetical protein
MLLTKQWNRRPLQVGSDIIQASFYDISASPGSKRQQDTSGHGGWSMGGEPLAKKYHSSESRLFSY